MNKILLPAILVALAAVGAQAQTIIDFTAAEGYVDGDINGQPSSGATWTQTTPGGSDPAFEVDATAGTLGLDSSRGAQYQSAIYNEAFSGTEFTMSVNFSVVRGELNPGTSPTTEYQYIALTTQAVSGSAVIARFGQLGTSDNRFFVRMFQNVTTGFTSTLGFDGTALGLDTLDTASDELQLTMTTTYSGSGDAWTSVMTLYNLTQSTQVATQTLNWTANATWTAADKQLALGNANFNLLDGSTVTFDQAAITAVPEPTSAAMIAGSLIGLLTLRRRSRR